MKQIRTIVVDDEPLARSRIINRLHTHKEILLVGECRNGMEATKIINKKKPDLVFLDIQMPDMDGFSIISKLNVDDTPFIIFVTAYDQYALKAFDVHAVDYLLKPFDNERFNEALNRAKTQIELRESSDFKEKLANLVNEYQNDQSPYVSKFTIKEKGHVKLIDVDDIYWIESCGNYVTLHLESQIYMYRTTMNAIELELDPRHFLRIHRSYLLNTLYIENVRYLSNNEYQFILKNENELLSGRSYKKKITEFISDTKW